VQGTRAEWQQVFFISSGFFLFGGVFFFIFARGEIQPWAVTEKPIELQLVNEEGEKVDPETGSTRRKRTGSDRSGGPLSKSEISLNNIPY